jgi:hypothetical protein
MNTQWSVALGEGVGTFRRDSTDVIFGQKEGNVCEFPWDTSPDQASRRISLPTLFYLPFMITREMSFLFHPEPYLLWGGAYLALPKTREMSFLFCLPFLSQVEWIRFYCKVFTALSDLVEEVL